MLDLYLWKLRFYGVGGKNRTNGTGTI